MNRLLIITFCFISFITQAAEYTVKTVPNPITSNAKTFVSNPDAILNAADVAQMNTLLDSLKLQTGAEVAVVAVNSIGSDEIKSFATNLFAEWKIGKEKKDNGLLVLFVLDQKKVTFETGYGLEGVLPDAICKRIQTQVMIPEFKNSDYDAGILAGLNQIAKYIRKGPVAEVKPEPLIAWSEVLPFAIGAYLLLMLFSWLWLGSTISTIRKNPKLKTNVERYNAVKSQKSGVISLVSIMIPLAALLVVLLFSNPIYLLFIIPIPLTTIPANIYGRLMMLKIRREPIKCNECDGKMHLLSEKKEDKFLKLSQQFEEQLHAVDYDVFVCDKCANEAIFTYDKPSAYSECPKCGTKAFIQKEKRTLVAPTYISSGTQRTTYICKFCGHEENHNDNLPRLTRNSALVGGAVAGSMFSGRGGFGSGGGFSGGSFGGGSSGGGGATSGW